MHWLCRSWCDLGKSVSDQPAVADHVVAARVRAAAGLPQIAPSEYVQERHQRDKTEDPPRQFSARAQVRPVGGQVDPHEDDSHGMQKANQDLKQLLHHLNLPRPAESGSIAVSSTAPLDEEIGRRNQRAPRRRSPVTAMARPRTAAIGPTTAHRVTPVITLPPI